MKKTLLQTVIEAIKKWNKEKKRTSWLYCPLCHNDLNGDNRSFLRESKNTMFWYYKCGRCGSKSKWHLYAPVPLVVSYQKLEKVLTES